MRDAPPRPTRQRGLLVGLALVLAALLVSCPLGVVAMRQGYLPPPRFVIHVGPVEFAAPCPSRGPDCSGPLPWYAIWRGELQPDGSTTYSLIYFTYLPRRR